MPRSLPDTTWFSRAPLETEPELQVSLSPAGLTGLAAALFPPVRAVPAIEALLGPGFTVEELMGLCCEPARAGLIAVMAVARARVGDDAPLRRVKLRAVLRPLVDVPQPGSLRLSLATPSQPESGDFGCWASPALVEEPLDHAALDQLSAQLSERLRGAAKQALTTPVEVHRVAYRPLGEAIASAQLDIDAQGWASLDLALLACEDRDGPGPEAELALKLETGWSPFFGAPVELRLPGRFPGEAALNIGGAIEVLENRLVSEGGDLHVRAELDLNLSYRSEADDGPRGDIQLSGVAEARLVPGPGPSLTLGASELRPPQVLRLEAPPRPGDRVVARILDALPAQLWPAIHQPAAVSGQPAAERALAFGAAPGFGGGPPRVRYFRERSTPARFASRVTRAGDGAQWRLQLSEAFLVGLLRQSLDDAASQPSRGAKVSVTRLPDRLVVDEREPEGDAARQATLALRSSSFGPSLLAQFGDQSLPLTHLGFSSPDLAGLLALTLSMVIGHDTGVATVLRTSSAGFDDGALVLEGQLQPWIDTLTLVEAARHFELGAQSVHGRLGRPDEAPWAFRLGCGAFIHADALFERLGRGDEVLHYHLSHSALGTPYLRGNPNEVSFDNVEAMPYVPMFARRNDPDAVIGEGVGLLKALGVEPSARPVRLVWDADTPARDRWPSPDAPDRFPQTSDWTRGRACPSAPSARVSSRRRRVLFNPAIAQPNAIGHRRHGYDDAGERQEFELHAGALRWRRSATANWAGLEPTRAMTYARQRAGERLEPPRFDLLATGGARILAKQEGRFRLFFTTVAPEFHHATPGHRSCLELAPGSAVRLPPSTPDMAVLGIFAALDPAFNRHLDDDGQPRTKDDWSAMAWPTLDAANGHPSLAPFTIPQLDVQALEAVLRALIHEVLAALSALALGSPTLGTVLLLVGVLRPQLEAKLSQALAALDALGGQSLARTTKALGLSPDVMLVPVEPGVWYHVDPRPPYDPSRLSEPPAFVRWEALVTYERIRETAPRYRFKTQHGVRAGQVLDIGVGHVYRHLSWDASNGGEFDTLDALGRSWYPSLLGPVDDGGGFIDGTTNFYALVELEVSDDGSLRALEVQRQAPDDFDLLGAVEGMLDPTKVPAQERRDDDLLREISTAQGQASFRKSFGIVWIDEQSYASDRFHLLHPCDAYWRLGKNWSALGQQSQRSPLPAFLRELITNHPTLGALYPIDAENETRFDPESFWCPFASDWFEGKACVSADSRMAVSRQVILVTGTLPDEPRTPVLFSINASYGTLDRSWRWRAYPAPVVAGTDWSALDASPATELCVPGSLRFRDDGTIVLIGRSGGVDGHWTQRYLPADTMEVPSGRELDAAHVPGERARVPARGYAHPWSFLPRTHQGRALYPDYDAQLHFGVPVRSASRSQFYLVDRIVDAAGDRAQLLAGGGEWTETRDRLFWPAPTELVRPRERRSPYNHRLRFHLRARGHWGALLSFADKRDDELPQLTTTLPPLGDPPPPIGELELQAGSRAITLEVGRRIRRWAPPAVQRAELAVDPNAGLLALRFYTRMPGLARRHRSRTIPWWLDSLGPDGVDVGAHLPTNEDLASLDPQLVERFRVGVGPSVAAIESSLRDPIFPARDAAPRDLPDFMIWRAELGRLGDGGSIWSVALGSVDAGGQRQFRFRRHGHFLYVATARAPELARQLAPEIRGGGFGLRLWFEDVVGHLACAEQTELRVETLA